MSVCPVCNIALVANSFDGVKFEECPKCLGTWVLESDLSTLEDKGAQELQRLDDSEGTLQSTGNTSTIGCCPVCRGPMEEFRFLVISPFMLHRCNSCGGLWIEHGELTQMAQMLGETYAPEQVAAAKAYEEHPPAEEPAIEKEMDAEHAATMAHYQAISDEYHRVTAGMLLGPWLSRLPGRKT